MDGIFSTIMYRNLEYFEHLFNVLRRYKLRNKNKKKEENYRPIGIVCASAKAIVIFHLDSITRLCVIYIIYM